MTKLLSPQKRNEVQKLILEAFNDDISNLSNELQNILVDDMVTAFQNRILIFRTIQAKMTVWYWLKNIYFKSINDIYKSDWN